MTLANRITICRLVLIPVFLVLLMSYTQDQPWLRLAALLVFLVAVLSDALDGFVARAYDQKTRLGAVLDPLADKLLINLALVFLAVNGAFQIPLWFPVIVVSRDAIIVIGSWLINEFYGPLRVRPRFTGKLTTVLQMGFIMWALLDLRFLKELLWATVVITVVSFFDYLYAGVKQVGDEDTS